MSTNRQAAASLAPQRKIAIAAGLLYLITHVTSIGAVALYNPILKDTNYITGSGSDTQVLVGVLLDVILALAIVGTSVALYPVTKRWSEGVALGYVGLRTLEACIIAVGVVPLLAVVTLRQVAGATAEPATLSILGSALVSLHVWTTLLGPGFVCGTNTVLMAYLMFRSRLVPRFIPVLGLVGGPLIFVFTTVKVFGFYNQLPEWVGIVVIPIFAWEITLAVYLIIRGFRSPAAASESAKTATTELWSPA